MTSALQKDGREQAPFVEAVEGAPAPGTLFADKYRIERLLGVGGMGYVLAARHVHLDERVAIKMLLPDRAKQDDVVKRFLREGRAAVKIRSEHVGRVLDVGSVDGVPFIVMEYLEGCDLADLLERQGRLRADVAVEFTLQACEAIAEAHAMGTVHRDLKPANLFLVRRADGSDCVKVLDFGISKMASGQGDGLSMTRTASTMGTPLYMSPEQLKSSRDVDARADVWSLGVILFELVSCRLPFEAESLAELSVKVLTEEPPDVRAFVPDVPAGVAEVIRRCLRRDAGARLASVAALAAALAPFGTPAARKSAEVIANVARIGGEGVGRDRLSSGALPAVAPSIPSELGSSGVMVRASDSVGVESTVSSDRSPSGEAVATHADESSAGRAARSGRGRNIAVAAVVAVGVVAASAAYGWRHHRGGGAPTTASAPPLVSAPVAAIVAAAPEGTGSEAANAAPAPSESVASSALPTGSTGGATRPPTTSSARASAGGSNGTSRAGVATSREAGRSGRASAAPAVSTSAAAASVPPHSQASGFTDNRHE